MSMGVDDYGRSGGRRLGGGGLSTILTSGGSMGMSGMGGMGGMGSSMVKSASLGGGLLGGMSHGAGSVNLGNGLPIFGGMVGVPDMGDHNLGGLSGMQMQGSLGGVSGMTSGVKYVGQNSAPNPVTNTVIISSKASSGYCSDGSMGSCACAGDHECKHMEYCFVAPGTMSGSCCTRQQTVMGRLRTCTF